MSLPEPASPAPSELTIRRLEWEPDEQLSSRTWAYTALLAGRPVAVQAVVFRADQSVLYLTPDLKRDVVSEEATISLVIRSMAERIQQDLAGLDVVFQQAAIEEGDDVASAALDAAGFQPLTEVCELSRPIGADPTLSSAENSSVELVATPLESPLWEQAFAASLAGGLDVPELLERRGAAESFQSLRLLAGDETEHWRIAFQENAVVGLVLPTPLPDGTAEIQYMGVSPEHRRQGIGQRLVADAIEAAVDLGATSLIVHVDVRNVPALRLYEWMGFVRTGCRSLWIK